MDESAITKYFEQKGVKPTANRILLLKALRNGKAPMSLADLENELATMDKSSIFRVLTLFLEQDVVHAFEDGRGILHYELCGNDGQCNHSDAHIHFYCESCRQSFCMEGLHIPKFDLPNGFTPHSVSFVIKGECPECRQKHGLYQQNT